jgi:hypothetical protein
MEKHADQLSERFLVFASNIITLVKRFNQNAVREFYISYLTA